MLENLYTIIWVVCAAPLGLSTIAALGMLFTEARGFAPIVFVYGLGVSAVAGFWGIVAAAILEFAFG